VTVDKTAAWVQILWGTGAFIVFWGSILIQQKRAEKRREVEFALLQQQVTYIVERMNKEFGGNSGGAREAINSLKSTVETIDKKVDTHGEDLAELRGRFYERRNLK